MEYHVNDGLSLNMVPDDASDAIISFVSFVHIHSRIVVHYGSQIARKLPSVGMAWIHHGAAGAREQDDRSDLTAPMMQTFSQRHDLMVTATFCSTPFQKLDTFGDCATAMYRREDLERLNPRCAGP